MLKPRADPSESVPEEQPPSGGCVLKLKLSCVHTLLLAAAAFGRLCVETLFYLRKLGLAYAAAFGRLCVETVSIVSFND